MTQLRGLLNFSGQKEEGSSAVVGVGVVVGIAAGGNCCKKLRIFPLVFADLGPLAHQDLCHSC